MSASQLKRIFDLIREAGKPISLGYLAHQLGITPQKAESMLDYWIRKGKISQTRQEADCDRCGICPSFYQFPASYQLVEDAGNPGGD